MFPPHDPGDPAVPRRYRAPAFLAIILVERQGDPPTYLVRTLDSCETGYHDSF
jgi:hypothetical protein